MGPAKGRTRWARPMINSAHCAIPVRKPRDAAKVGVAQCAEFIIGPAKGRARWLISPHGMSLSWEKRASCAGGFSGPRIKNGKGAGGGRGEISVVAGVLKKKKKRRTR